MPFHETQFLKIMEHDKLKQFASMLHPVGNCDSWEDFNLFEIFNMNHVYWGNQVDYDLLAPCSTPDNSVDHMCNWVQEASIPG